MSGLIDDLRANINDILRVRDDLGAALKPVYIVTRTWTGLEPGDGEFSDEEVQILPSPRIVEYKNEYKIQQGGAVQQGDIALKMVSKQSFPEITQVDGTVPDQNTEVFYKVGGYYYRVIHVREKFFVYEIQLRKVSKQ